MKKSHIVIVILAIILVYIVLPRGSEDKPASKTTSGRNGPPEGYMEYSDRLHWVWNDIEGALKQAGEENKFVLVDFWASWCGWCIKADREVFPESLVEDVILQHYIPVKIDTDRFPQMQSEYGVRGLPTIVILDKEGKVKGRIVGFRQADELVALLLQFAGG